MLSDVPTLSELETVFGNIVSVVLALSGIVFFVMLLIGGFKFLTAGGEAPQIESARKTLTYAIFGMILVSMSFLILKIIESFTGVNVTDFRILQP